MTSDNWNNNDNWDDTGDSWQDNSNSGEFSETEYRSWWQRIMDSIKGVLFGLLFVIVSGGVLFWNEGRAAKTAAALTEGAGIVQSVPNNATAPANNGRLVHVSGDTTASSEAADPDFGFSQKGLKLSRKVEMYQWKEEKSTETRKNLGGGEERVTTYRYVKVWSDRRINSNSFRRQNGHQNPDFPAVRSRSFAAAGAKLGAFKLNEGIIGRLGAGERVDVPDALLTRARERLGNRTRIQSGAIYAGYNPDSPSIGDVRVTYSLLPLQTVSVVAKQVGDGLEAYTAGNGRQILLASTGAKDAAAMFQSAQDSNTMLTWVIRAFGILFMFAGFAMVLAPISVVASVVPILGDIAGFGTSLIAMIATAITAPVIIAIAWFFYRPLLSAIVLAVGVAVVYGLKQWGKQRAAGRIPARAARA
ncbi:MAG: TMEM43 family protein [Beijerinckiaceae bacterium]